MSNDNNELVFPEKFIKKLPTGFTDEADAMSVDDLKKLIVRCEGNVYTIDKEKDADIKLSGAKEIVKELSEPYREAKTVQQLKIKYALFILEGKGVDVGG